jgi:hypothetical protein
MCGCASVPARAARQSVLSGGSGGSSSRRSSPVARRDGVSPGAPGPVGRRPGAVRAGQVAAVHAGRGLHPRSPGRDVGAGPGGLSPRPPVAQEGQRRGAGSGEWLGGAGPSPGETPGPAPFAVSLACRTRSARLGDGGGRRVGAAPLPHPAGYAPAGTFTDADLARVRPNRARQFTCVLPPTRLYSTVPFPGQALKFALASTSTFGNARSGR